MSNNSVLLPNGEQFLIHMDYTKAEAEAVFVRALARRIILDLIKSGIGHHFSYLSSRCYSFADYRRCESFALKK